MTVRLRLCARVRVQTNYVRVNETAASRIKSRRVIVAFYLFYMFYCTSRARTHTRARRKRTCYMFYGTHTHTHTHIRNEVWTCVCKKRQHRRRIYTHKMCIVNSSYTRLLYSACVSCTGWFARTWSATVFRFLR